VAASKGLAKYQRPVLEALGLISFFVEVLTPDTYSALKRDRAFYGPWPERAAVRIMTGDHYEDDVVAPYSFGFNTVWKWNGDDMGLRDLDPFARALAFPYTSEQPVRPDAIIFSLRELPPVVLRLETRSGGAI
jgi:FMN phosphatase YigB (HAD superfamily)